MNKTKIEILKNALAKLSKEFGVDCPQLLTPKTWKRGNIAGFYVMDTITLNPFFINNDIACALRILRHEFAHYLQDLWNFDKRCEIQARRFEKKSLVIGMQPKSQTTLIQEFPERNSR